MSTARSISTIQTSLRNALTSDPVIGPLWTASGSSVDPLKLITYIIAVSQATEENIINQAQINLEGILESASPSTLLWIQKMAFYFQWSSTVPQTIQLNTTTLAPYYPNVNSSYNIITQCSVSSNLLSSVLIKVAQGSVGGLFPLTGPQLSAFQSYMNYIKPAGIIYNCISLPGDIVYCAVNATFSGAYIGTIANDLLNAYNNYLYSIPFNGTFILSDLMVALKKVSGIMDIEFKNVNINPDSASFPAGGPYNIVNNYTQNLTKYTSYSGYFIDHPVSSPSGYDFLSSLTLIPV